MFAYSSLSIWFLLVSAVYDNRSTNAYGGAPFVAKLTLVDASFESSFQQGGGGYDCQCFGERYCDPDACYSEEARQDQDAKEDEYQSAE